MCCVEPWVAVPLSSRNGDDGVLLLRMVGDAGFYYYLRQDLDLKNAFMKSGKARGKKKTNLTPLPDNCNGLMQKVYGSGSDGQCGCHCNM